MARSFDSALSQYCQVDSNLAVTGPPFWISAWVFPVAHADQAVCFLGDKDAAEEHHMLFIVQGGRVQARTISTGSGYAFAETVTTVTLSAWQHVMGVWAAHDDRRVYLGGTPWANDTFRSATGLDRTSVGRAGDSTPEGYFAGRIAELAVGTGTPSDSQVAALAGGFDPRLVFPRSSLRAFWPFLGGDEDLLGEHSLTAYNSPSWAEHPPLIHACRPRAVVLGASSFAVGPAHFTAAGRVWHTGATAGQVYVTGQVAGQIHG